MSAAVVARQTCRMCDGRNLDLVLSLAPTPPGNRLLSKAELGRDEVCYPLDLNFCADCTHVQLGHVVNPSILYQDEYLYVSGTSSQFVRHLEEYAMEMVGRFNLTQKSLVVDIGSNDGTCLKFFQRQGMQVVGVDPAPEIARTATAAGIETVNAFFSLPVAMELRERFGPASFITSHNACAHIDQLEDVVRGVAHWLDARGLFVAEVGYFADVLRNLYFDTVYHEHLDYHTVAPFRQLFARTGMELISVQRISPQGGSIRVVAQKAGGSRVPDSSVASLIDLERATGVNRRETVVAFGHRITELRTQLRSLLFELKAAGKTIAAFGAPTKAVTLLTHFGIGAEWIDFVVEDNALKHGRYLPLSHIPVLPTDELYRRSPDYAVILAWNFAEPIMRQHTQFARNGGRFIVPMPEPRVV